MEGGGEPPAADGDGVRRTWAMEGLDGVESLEWKAPLARGAAPKGGAPQGCSFDEAEYRGGKGCWRSLQILRLKPRSKV
ncbi:hypothetical protein AMTR_s00136p00029510 [Amborella trichopoda]|uniref:Uncharacterized protein n=1 Tax=Amborella trichopoda TaxID=13333 RepID=W1NDY4_AMBTC|nr:hypothetical protein AMTR_s00136p00029510 [Amborella trichopoda]